MPESATVVERLRDAAATLAAGRRLAEALVRSGRSSSVVYLEGELGAGKTTLARGVLAGLGHAGRVPSPTYTLIEPYDLPVGRVCHIDLYRVRDPRELDDLALPEILEPATHALVEWPDHGAGHLPAPDLLVRLQIQASGRQLSLTAASAAGRDILALMDRQA
jgi:tRNA threonylcarbamoyladenosine biosynthesis protein TsaE